jgi:serine/threonine protein phosphatase PrpC
MTAVIDGLGGEGNDAIASEKLAAVLPNRLTEAYNGLRTASPDELLKYAESLSIITRDPETGALAHAKDASQKRTALFANLYPEITRKATAISRALQAANEDVIASGGKTTVSFSVIHTEEDGGIFAITANIGDSGTLVRRANGDVETITMEDNLLDQLIEGGFLSAELLEQMKKEPTKQFAIPRLPKSFSYVDIKRTMVHALGGKSVEPRISVTELQKGESVIALTDGYLDFLEHEGELDLEAVKGALKENDPVARMNRLREITGVRYRLQKQDGENLKELDDMAAVELSV